MYFKNIGFLFFLFFSYLATCQTILITDNKVMNEKINLMTQKADSCKVNFDYKSAHQYIANALLYAQNKKDINAEIFCTIKFVELYRHATLYEKAVFYLDEVSKLINENTKKVNVYNEMYFYNRKAALFSEYYNIADSIIYYSNKALILAEKQNNFSTQFASSMEIGLVFENRKEFQKAIAFYQKSYTLAQKNNKISESCDALVNMARVYKKSKNYNKALEMCNKGLLILENNTIFFQKLLLYDIKQNIYEKTGDVTNAYKSLKLRLKYTSLYYEKDTKIKLLEENKKFELLEKQKIIIKNEEEINQVLKSQLLLMAVIALSVMGVISLIYYSKKISITNKKLDDFAKENAFLLSEANHRINNNLQLVIILISDQLKNTKGQENIHLKNILAKVDAISTLHKHLYKNKDKRKIDVSNYLTDVSKSFFEVFEEQNIKTTFTIDSIEVQIDYAMYLGLLLTELCINSIKHAFKEQENKEIKLILKQVNNTLLFTYQDNGKAIHNTAIQPKLVNKICRQLGLKYTISTTQGFIFSFEQSIKNG